MFVSLIENYFPHFPAAEHLAEAFLFPPHLALFALSAWHFPALHFAPASTSLLFVQAVKEISARPNSEPKINFLRLSI
jgi:hypothetical protein